MRLSHDECCERKFLAHAGRTFATFHFVIEVGEAAEHADQERLAPTAAAFGCLTFLDEHVVVLADFLGGLFGRNALGCKRGVVQERECVAVKRVGNADGIHAAVQKFVELLDVGFCVLHPEETFDFVSGDVALGDNHRFHEVEGDFFAVRCVKENLFDFFAHKLGIVTKRFGEVLRSCWLDSLVEMRWDNCRNPVGHFVLLRYVVLFDFADLRERLVKLATGEERFKVKEHFATCRMGEPFGDCLAIVGFHGFGLAYDDDLFWREHRHGIACFDDDIGDGGYIGVGGV